MTVLDRLAGVEAKFDGSISRLDTYIFKTDQLEMKFNADYDAFVRDRKRWQSDFDIATKSAEMAV